MLTKLKLKNFKNFKDAELTLGNLTILVGTNASGKSNLRDAFRFLHGIARGYSLAEIIGEKWIEGGVLQWRGIRGGMREIAFQGESNFSLEVDFMANNEKFNYYIQIEVSSPAKPPKVISERLSFISATLPEYQKYDQPCYDGSEKYDDIFNSNYIDRFGLELDNPLSLKVKLTDLLGRHNILSFSDQKPIISQILDHSSGCIYDYTKVKIMQAILAFGSMRFLDLSPDMMRLPSFPGQTILGDQGQNLSSVLQKMCEDDNSKQVLIQWIETLTPMDASDFEFTPDQTGKILLTLIENSGLKISAYSASDGTLRFLAMIAALLGSEPARFYFFEELENGIHPTRLYLLLQLIERKVNEGKIQMVATTHSSLLLRFLSQKTLESTSLIYRLKDRKDAQIIRILDIPDTPEIIKEQSLARLHESAWLENVMEFMEEESE